jgi:PEP-CTERM motif
MKVARAVAFAVATLAVTPLVASAAPLVRTGTIEEWEVADIWQLTVTGGAFSVNTNHPLGTGIDTQLFLFDAFWHGVAADDDDPNLNPNPNGALPSSISCPLLFVCSGLAAGTYYLAVAPYDIDPVDSNGNLIFPNFAEPQVGPWGPGGGNTFAGFNSDPVGYPYNGDYTLTFTGVEEATPVPEPATLTLLGTGALALVRRARRKTTAV